MNPEKRRKRAKRKAKVGRILRNGGLRRLQKLYKGEALLDPEDINMLGPKGAGVIAEKKGVI